MSIQVPELSVLCSLWCSLATAPPLVCSTWLVGFVFSSVCLKLKTGSNRWVSKKQWIAVLILSLFRWVFYSVNTASETDGQLAVVVVLEVKWCSLWVSRAGLFCAPLLAGLCLTAVAPGSSCATPASGRSPDPTKFSWGVVCVDCIYLLKGKKRQMKHGLSDFLGKQNFIFGDSCGICSVPTTEDFKGKGLMSVS